MSVHFRSATLAVHSFYVNIYPSWPSSVKGDFRRLFHAICISKECAICVVTLLLDCRSELQQLIWYWLICCFEDIDQCTSKRLFCSCEECDGSAILSSSSGSVSCQSAHRFRYQWKSWYIPSNSMHIVLHSKWECDVDNHLHSRDVESSCSDVCGDQ